MRSYETVFIVKPELVGESFEKICNSVKDFLEKGSCQIIKEENWGKRRLAYEIDKYREGQYYYIKYATNNFDVPKELERFFNLNEGVLRYLSVKIEDTIIEKNEKQDNVTSTAEHNVSDEKEESVEIQSETNKVED